MFPAKQEMTSFELKVHKKYQIWWLYYVSWPRGRKNLTFASCTMMDTFPFLSIPSLKGFCPSTVTDLFGKSDVTLDVWEAFGEGFSIMQTRAIVMLNFNTTDIRMLKWTSRTIRNRHDIIHWNSDWLFPVERADSVDICLEAAAVKSN